MGVRCLPEGRLDRLTAVSRHVAELVNLPPHSADPDYPSSGARSARCSIGTIGRSPGPT